MKDKIRRFFSSYFGHVTLAFAVYCVFVWVILLSLKVILPSDGLNGLSDDVQVSLAELQTQAENTDDGLRHIKIAIVLGNMGLSDKTTKQAVEELPGGISFAFSPYADDLDKWFADAHKYGHDLLLEIPMEPYDYPNSDPGPASLLTRYSNARNIDVLDSVLRKAHGYSGVTPWMGGAFMTSADHLDPVLKHLKDTNLYLVRKTSTGAHKIDVKAMARAQNLPYVETGFVLDKTATRAHILEQLDVLEGKARIGSGYAVAFAQAYPVTIATLKDWEKTLDEKNISLVPMMTIAQHVFAENAPE